MDNYDFQPAISSEFFETNEDSFFHKNAALDYTIVRLKRKPYLVQFGPTSTAMRGTTSSGWPTESRRRRRAARESTRTTSRSSS